MKIKLTEEEIELMSYDDVAYLILNTYKNKMKIQDLFKRVIKALKLPDEEFTDGIGDFFELLITDKRFIMLENGAWDLKTNHSLKKVASKIDEDEDDDEDIEFIIEENENELSEQNEEEDESEVNYDEDSTPDDDNDDGLADLIVVDEEDKTDSL